MEERLMKTKFQCRLTPDSLALSVAAVTKNILTNVGLSFRLALTLLFGFIGSAFAADPLVDAAWVKANLGKPGVVVVDIQGTSDYLRGHIPGAASTDFGKSGWREDRADKVP